MTQDQLNNCRFFSPVSVNVSLLGHPHSSSGDPQGSAPRDTAEVLMWSGKVPPCPALRERGH